ncbi:hypothetical protein [Clostridium sp. Marseille-Q2269]|uniref:hypothetical protein n=1 Tax=Clostridium sp. Marseille-Q2269 TaxID=2942205 RepID=UPI002074A62E|nr:hypothetical protein [Clostridium sp. Marseille-Q2269]
MEISKEEFIKNISALQIKKKRKKDQDFVAVMTESFYRCKKKSRNHNKRVRGQI